MKIAVLGAGFTGLAAAYQLTKNGYDVTVFEKDSVPGGLAIGYKEKGWEWSLEKHYHHFFTNDFELINLAKELKLSSSLIYPPSLTSVYTPGMELDLHTRKKHNSHIYPFNTPLQILNFSPLNILNRLRLGFITTFLKILPESLGIKLEQYTAFELAQKLFGQEVFKVIWQPLFTKKFGPPAGGYASRVNFSWLWARIKKRTLQLGYVSGGFQTISNALAQKIQEQGGKIVYDTEIKQIRQKNGKWNVSLRGASTTSDEAISKNLPVIPDLIGNPLNNSIDSRFRGNDKGKKVARNDKEEVFLFDAVISTLPTPVFTKLAPGLPQNYVKQLSSIPHLHALNLVLETKEPFLKDTYWLNINEPKFPFLCVVQHTNFIDKKHYNNNHLLCISNYLPLDHPYFKKTAQELLQIYLPYLKNLNPSFLKSYIISLKSFTGLYAQPVFLTNYSQIRPFGQVLPNLYFANLDSVYPWDRGTNYALEIGRKIAELIIQNSKVKSQKHK